MIAVEIAFWFALAALVWTHAAYPALVWSASRLAPRRVRMSEQLPSVAVIVAAHDEEAAIAGRIENLFALDYPRDRLEIVLTSDASTDRTEEIAEALGVRVIRNSRGGKVAAQDKAVRETKSEIVAFSDANATWAPDALRKLVRMFGDERVAYVCGQLHLQTADGSNKEGLYWRYELAVREAESRLGSVTGGNGAIYAVRRSDYVDVDPRFGHDLALPYLLVQRGRRAVYEPQALAFEKPTSTNVTEYKRKIRMFEHCWLIVLRGKMLRSLDPMYLVAIVSHRHFRYASGLLHLLLLGTSIALVADSWIYQTALGVQIGVIAAAAVGVSVARYYVLVTWATVVALWNYLRRGVPATWEAVEGARGVTG